MNLGRLRFGYRAMQVALAATCLALVAKWYDQHLSAQKADPSLAARQQMRASGDELFDRASRQRDDSKKLLEAAEARLKTAEAREVATKEQP
ncbi:MAG TPA: hypothetical protein VH107_17605 [Lacipirellulaceae bacterium]|jgi:hypothetical protein|nr:hypothetical protein [Lacipirellulaceae bacterium]